MPPEPVERVPCPGGLSKIGAIVPAERTPDRAAAGGMAVGDRGVIRGALLRDCARRAA